MPRTKKWLLISSRQDLLEIILSEYKRKPAQFDRMEPLPHIEVVKGYDMVIVGSDVELLEHKEYRHQLFELSYQKQINLKYVSYCEGCKKEGVRLDMRLVGEKYLCKSCRPSNLHLDIMVNIPSIEAIQKWIEPEPKEIILSNPKLPDEIKPIIQAVIDNYFPEITGVEIGFTNACYGQYCGGWKIRLDPKQIFFPKGSFEHTIAHEFQHMIQRGQDVFRQRAKGNKYLYQFRIPSGEKACDIWTYARSPDLSYGGCYLDFKALKPVWKALHELELSEAGARFFNARYLYCKTHSNDLHELAKRALEIRATNRRYIKWYEAKIAELRFPEELYDTIVSGPMPKYLTEHYLKSSSTTRDTIQGSPVQTTINGVLAFNFQRGSLCDDCREVPEVK